MNKSKLRYVLTLSAGVVEYTGCFSADGEDPHPLSVQDMTLNNLMVLFQ